MSTIKGFVQNERIEIRENNGRSVCNFDICVSEGAQYKDTEGNYKPRTGWRALFVKVEMWGQKDKVQPMVENLKKGSLVAVTGDLGMKSHEYNGQTYTNVSMMAYKVEPLVKG